MTVDLAALAKLAAEVTKRNPHAGEFYFALASQLEARNKQIEAEPYFREAIRVKLPLIGDANELSERGDGLGVDDCSYIDAGEADYAGSDGRRNGNRFSDRHSGGTNYLFQDLHGAWDTRLREELSRDYDLNGVIDIDVRP